MSLNSKLIVQRLAAMRKQSRATGRVIVGYSGGLDSSVLLHLLARAGVEKLCAVHIAHGLAQNTDEWIAFVEQQAASLPVALEVIALGLKPAPGESVEAVAREARYAAFKSVMHAGDALVLAQHRDDQAQTLLLQLLRGAGPAGLAAMPAVSDLGDGVCLRPLLEVPRKALEEYAAAQALAWFDDPSNADLRFDRNYLRRKVMSRVSARWSGAVTTLARAAELQAQTHSLLMQLAAGDARAVVGSSGSLSVSKLNQLPNERQANLIRFILHSRDLPVPSQARMTSVLALLTARESGAVDWSGVSVRRYRDALNVLPTLPRAPQPEFSTTLTVNEPAQLPSDLGQIVWHCGPDEVEGCADLQVRFRRAGERLRDHPARGSRTLSKWFQEQGVAPWQRERMPLIIADEQIVAVADQWLASAPAKLRKTHLSWVDKPLLGA